MTKPKTQAVAEKPAQKGVFLWSPRGNMDDLSTHIGLTSGHTLIIPHDKEGVSVPPKYRKEAIARGCIPVGMVEEDDDSGGFDRGALIREKLQEMLAAEDPTMFTTDGKPVLQKLVGLCGFAVDRSEVNRIWDAMHAEVDEDGPGGSVISNL